MAISTAPREGAPVEVPSPIPSLHRAGPASTATRTGPDDPRWAGPGLDGAIWRSTSACLGLWTLALGGLVTASADGPRLLVAGLHIVFCAYALIDCWRDRSRVGYFCALFSVVIVDLVVADSHLAVAGICMTFPITATAFLVLPTKGAALVTWGWTALAAGCCIVVDVAPSGPTVAVSLVTTTACFSVAATGLMTLLRSFIDEIDVEARALAHERNWRVEHHAASTAAAEQARLLHDTLVNTLTAIGSGGTAVSAPDLVRARCRDDLAALLPVIEGGRSVRTGLDGVDVGISLHVQWTGLHPDERRALESRMPRATRAALRGIVKELLLNVEKHAGVDRAVIDVRATDDALEVSVTDRGTGFHVMLEPGRGLAESVLARACEVGIGVQVSSTPGEGVCARIRCPLGAAGERTELHEQRLGSARISRTASWMWSASVAGASAVIAIVGAVTTRTIDQPAGCVGAATVLLVVLTSWGRTGARTHLSTRLALGIAVASPVAYVLWFQAVRNAPETALFWPGLSVTPLLVTLLGLRAPRVITAAAVLGVALAGTYAALAASSGTLGGVAAVNAATQIAQFAIFWLFLLLFARIGRRAAAQHRQVLLDRADRAALEATRSATRSWRVAGVAGAVDFLTDVAEGRRVPSDPSVRVRAANEAHFLRQLLLLDPRLVHLGPWMARALARGRERGLHLRLAVQDTDHSDPRTAADIGTALLDLLADATPGSDLTISYLRLGEIARLTVVGQRGFADRAMINDAVSEAPRLHRALAGRQELVEIRPAPRQVGPTVR